MPFLQHPQYPGRTAFDSQVKELFGLAPKDKWPAAGMPARWIQNIYCWVEPVWPDHFRIRARCLCPICDKDVPIGRLRQHASFHGPSSQ